MPGAALIVDWVRLPRGKSRTGTLAGLHPQDLLGQALDGLHRRVDFDPRDIDDVVAGCGNQTGDHADNPARLALLAQGWPVEVPGTTVNRYCGSGQQAATFAAHAVAAGQQDAVIACGVEMWSRYGEVPPALDGGNPRLREAHPTVPQGIAGDLIATLEGFSREDVDAFGARSHQRAEAARAAGRFARSIVAATDHEGRVLLEEDDAIRPGTTAEGMAGLTPSFADYGAVVPAGESRSYDQMCLERYPELDAVDHVHHAGNSSAMTDGAAAMLIVSEQFAEAHGLTPRAQIRATGVASAEPVVMLTGPTPASRKCLARAGMTVEDLDLIEVNEAFASVPLKTTRDLDLDPERVNVNGGAIALGHPVGATGVILMGTLLDELERRDGTAGLVTICTGAGMGTASIIERI